MAGQLTKVNIGKEDLQLQTNTDAAETYDRTSSTGPNITMTKFPDIWGYQGAIRPGDIIPKGPWVDVRAYGAARDSTTNNLTAFQSAIDSGKPVYVPGGSGYYKVSGGSLTLDDNTYIFGDGITSQIRQTTAGTDLFVGSSKSNITLAGLYLYGTTGAARAIEFTTVTDSIIRYCIIYSWGDEADGSGIWLDNASNDNKIIGNKLDTCYYGIYIGGFDTATGSSRNTVEGNTVKSSVAAGIFVNKATKHIIRGNVVHGSGLPGIYLRQASNYNTVTANTIYSNGDSGIYIWDGDSTDCIGNTVNGNTLYDNTPAEIFLRTVTNNSIVGNTCMSSQGYGIYLTDAASKNVVANNVIKSATNDGIRLYYDGSEWCRECLIQGNEVISSGAYGISLYNAHESQVKDNMLVNNTDYGIYITAGSEDVAASHNILKGNDGGIYFNNADNSSIIDNLIESLSDGSSEYGIQITANSSGALVQGNRIRISSNTINNLAGSSTIVKGNTGLDETVTAASPTLQHWGYTNIDSTSNAVDGTLGSGAEIGQLKTIVMTEASNSSTISVTNHETSDPEVFTFADVDDTLVLMWTGTEWITVANSGVAV